MSLGSDIQFQSSIVLLLKEVNYCMTGKMKNDFFYVCSLIEYISRLTKNKRGFVVKTIGYEGVKKLLHDAEMDHCLSFEQVADEVIRHYDIPRGDFEPESGSPYKIPGFQDIGKLYATMIEDLAEPGKETEELIKVFSSFISDAISDFRSDLYYQNPDYLEWSYREGRLLEP